VHVLLVAQQLRRRVPGGIGTYARGLLQGLHSVGADTPAVTLLASTTDEHPDPVADLGVPLRTVRLPAPVLTRAWDRALLRAPADVPADVVHAPSLAAPPPRSGTPLVVAVHDVAWREVPETFPRRGRRWHEAALRRAIHRGAVLATPTEEAAAALSAAGADPSRVRVLDAMYGADHLPPADPAATAATLEALGVRGPYVLTVGTLEPRKNLAMLLEAYGRARFNLPEPWPLVVVGPAGWGEAPAPVPGVVPAGAVPAPVLAGLYAGARCLAYVPLFEGFGLPVLEAMAACTPVVASKGLPSSAGVALEVDPTDADAIADAIAVAAGDDRRRAELVTAGLLRSGELTWEAAARSHMALWEDVA
jgi:glycosyltransferase involved in cell wall biosynthesis